MLSDHYRSKMTERLFVRVITVDPANRRIEVVGKDAAVIPIGISVAPPLFRWPKQGEFWTITRENGEWQLENYLPGPDESAVVQPGEALIQAEKIWTPSGDYLLRKSELDAAEADLTAADDAFDARLNILEAPPEAWKSIGADGGLTTFTSPWASYSATYVAQYRKRIEGVVECRGLVKITTGTISSGAIFTLPTGYRPSIPVASSQFFPSSAHSGSAYVESDVEVAQTGIVLLTRASSAIGTSGWVSLNSIRFSIN